MCLLCAISSWRLSPRLSAWAAQAQSAKSAAAAQQTSPKLQPVNALIPASSTPNIPPLQRTAAPGTELYTAKRGEAIPTIARRYLGRTSYLTSSELAEAIRQANKKADGRSNILKANEVLIIPGILPAPIVEKTVPIPKDFEVRAVYLTGVMAGSDRGLRIIRHWREVGGNAVVFDIKDSDGSLSIPFEHPLVSKHNVYIHDVSKFVHFLHQQNMHAIARIAIFRDERLVTEHPELAVQSRRTHQPWREKGKLVWTDPSNPKVQEYNIALAKYVAQLGVDEIQFDYVRFPAEGDQKDALFAFQKDIPAPAQDVIPTGATAPTSKSVIPTGATAPGGTLRQPSSPLPSTGSPLLVATPNSRPQTSANASPQASASTSPEGAGCESPGRKSRVGAKSGTNSRRDATGCAAVKHAAPQGLQRSDVITAFLKKAYAEIHPTGALFSLDVFGVMAWQRPIDLSHTGQDIVGMAHHCDVLSPMIYPSHFFGMDDIARPGDAPEHFIGESMDRFMLITKGSGVVIRPWLQAFHWRTKTYSPEYIKVQVLTAKNKGGIGFLFWNAGNDYSKPFVAMPEMKAANYKEGSKDNPKYFRGDELPAPSVQAALAPSK